MGNSMKNRLLEAIGKLSNHDHLCLIYETRAEQFDAVVPFIRIGLENGEKCIYIADENTADDVLSAMRSGGVDVESALSNGALVIISKKETYLRHGYFDPDEMIRFLKESTDSAKKEGFSALRATGEMTWVLGDEAGTLKLMEYESKLNLFFPENDCLALCQYNRSRFSPEILADVIHTHPLVIASGFVCKNFYYIPPEEFLKKEKKSLEVERLLFNLIDREKAEVTLRQSEEKFSKAFHATPDAIIMTRVSDNRLIDVNEVFVHHSGYSREEAVDHTSLEFNLWANLEDRERYFTTLREKGSVREQESQFRMKSGKILDGLVSGETFRMGDEMFILTIIRDITERKRTEEELKKHREHLEELVKERTAELENKNKDLEIMIKGLVGRELRMIELKNIIEDLERKLGERHEK
jgi:PAS domain S-box-containing protein